MPKVSAIILTRNRVGWLPAAIKSILNQTCQDFEVIVVDDASTDETPQVVRSFGDGRIRYIRHEVNQGESRARNTGVNHSRGEYLAFLDDDDEWVANKLEMQLAVLETSPPIVGGIYTGYWKIDKDSGRLLGQVIPEKRGDILREMSVHNWVGTPSTVLLRKLCFDRVGLFDESIVYGPDYDMWIRISRHFNFECLQEPLVRYSVSEGQMSSNHALMIRGKEMLLNKHGQFFAQDERSFSMRYFVLGIHYCFDGNPRMGRTYFLKAMKIFPYFWKYYYYYCLSFLDTKLFVHMIGLPRRFHKLVLWRA